MSEGKTTRLPRISLARDLPRWGLAALVAVGAHAAVAAGVVAFAPVKEAISTKPAMTVELQPLVISEAESVEQVDSVAAVLPEEVVEEETPVEEEVETVEEEAEEEPVEEVVEETPEEVIEEAKPTPVAKKPAVVLPKPAKKRVERKVEKKKVEQPAKKVAEKPVRKKAVDSPSKVNSSARKSAPAPSASEFARWRAKVNATLARRKPRGLGVSGTVTLRIGINGSGSIVSASVASSSDPRLNSAALSMARGGVPAPPAGSGSSFSLNLPVRFN